MTELTAGQLDALKTALRITAAAGALGAGARAGIGVLRNARPRYDPPRSVDPMFVDIPVPSQDSVNPGDVAIPSRMKALRNSGSGIAKVATPNPAPEWLTKIPGGTSAWNALPDYQSPTGDVTAAKATDVPLYGAGYVLGTGAGLVGGYHLMDKLLNAADRRRAQAELDAAKQEYHNTVINRAKGIYFDNKTAADVAALVSDDTPIDPEMQRVKRALDAAFEKAANPEIAPAPAPAPGASENSSPEVRALMTALWPGLGLGSDAARIQMGAVGTLAGLGGYLGYNASRDPDTAAATRKAIKRIDEANAYEAPPPVIGRLIPVAAR